MPRARRRRYHHGNLRRVLLDEALAVIAERGPLALSMRELARRAGVSHSAPEHHFADRAALLTAIATEGYERLAEALAESAGGTFLDTGLAYVRFALEHPGHVQVMYQPAVYRADDPAVDAARTRTRDLLYRSAATLESPQATAPGRPPAGAVPAGVAGWCLMHGFATLWLAGNLRHLGDDPIEVARAIGLAAFASPPPRRGPREAGDDDGGGTPR